MKSSVFEAVQGKSFPYTYHGQIEVDMLVGGVPSNENVAKGWLETKLKNVTTEDQIQRLVAETMVDRKISEAEALDIVNKMKNLNGFKRVTDLDNLGQPTEGDGELYYEGRQLKAALKEAVSVAAAVGKIKIQGWGNTRKWIQGFFPEHVFILEKKLTLGVMEPTGILQQFVHTRFGSSIQYQEYVTDVSFGFTVVTDHAFTDEDWAMIWTTGERNGLGAGRSQGYGTYRVVKWDKEIDRSAPRVQDDEPVVRTKRSKAT